MNKKIRIDIFLTIDLKFYFLRHIMIDVSVLMAPHAIFTFFHKKERLLTLLDYIYYANRRERTPHIVLYWDLFAS